MSHDEIFNLNVPAITMPETRVFAHSTRMSDFDSPSIESIIKPAADMHRHQVKIHLATSSSKTRTGTRPKPNKLVHRLKYNLKTYLDNREPTIDIGEKFAIDLRFSDTSNYAHLIHDVLAPVRMVEQELARSLGVKLTPINIILPKKPSPLALKVLDFAGVPVICTNGVVRGQLISVTRERNIAMLPHLERQPFKIPTTETPERVFVSRRGPRSLINENEVTEFLEKENFERIYMEDLSLADQWATLGRAKEIVGIHGAGLSSLGFSIHRSIQSGPRFRLIELFSAGFSSSCFREYSAVLGGTWVGVRGKITPEIVRDLDLLGNSRAHDQASFEVDIDSLSEALSYSRGL